MTIRNLQHMFQPKSIALIGASRRAGSVGAILARNLFNSGFDGPVMPVNPKHQAVEGVLTYADVASLPVTPDLAVVATPPAQVPRIVSELGARGTRAVVVITAGFGEGGDRHGAQLRQALLDAARPHLLRVVGPNCLGILVPGVGLNASFAHIRAEPGRLAFVAQSGAVVTSVVDWARPRGIGFSHLVSLGDMADVDFGDMLDYLASDAGTRAILLYIEAVTSARKFMSAARAAARMKPVLVVKAGRHAEAARAASSHTGALAGSDAVYDAVFRRAGMLRVRGLDELFDAAEILALARPPAGERMAILTNGGGIGVLATDALIDAGGRLAELAPATVEKLDACLPPTWSHGNPIDIIGDAPGSRYVDALDALWADPGIDGILVLNCPTGVASGVEAAEAVAGYVGERRGPAVLSSWVGEWSAQQGRQVLMQRHIPTYETPTKAVRAFMYMVDYRRGQETLMQTPPSVPADFTPDPQRVRELVARALEEGREWLTEPEAKDVLDAYGVPVAATRVARTPAEAGAAAAAIGGPVALKIVSPDITHKSDVGGVALDLAGEEVVREAASAMQRQIGRAHPQARLQGFSVEPMVRRHDAYELIVGAVTDRQFGPVILFGQGGTAVEVVDDKALGLPPLNMHLAHELISRTRIHRQLQGFRGLPPVDLDAVALALIRVARLVAEIAEVAELDVNPLVADRSGVIALDARVRVSRTQGAPEQRLAIRPYPKELEEDVALGDGRILFLRPILPEDEPALRAAFAKLTPEEIRLRFFVPMKTLTHMSAARFTQIDYDREMALVLTDHGTPGETPLYAVVHLTSDPDGEHAEYAIIVRHDMTGMGLGILLMRRIIDYARRRGIGTIHGDVLRENTTMLKLCEALGFTTAAVPEDPGLVRVVLEI